MSWFSGGISRVIGRNVLGLAQASALIVIVPLAEERDAGMLAGGFQKWLLGIPKSKVVITSQIGVWGGAGQLSQAMVEPVS